MVIKNKKANDHRYYLKHREAHLLKMKQYYKEHSEIIKDRTRKWYQDHKNIPEIKDRIKVSVHKSYLKNREQKLSYSKGRWLKMRLMLLDYLGGKCERCGFEDYRALQIDHVNGGGVRELKNLKSIKSPIKYLEHIKPHREEYQLLCANCNWIKKYENEENAQKRIN